MVEVCRAVWRVLRDDGTLWLNIGDSYNSGTSAPSKPSKTADVGGWTTRSGDAAGSMRTNCVGLKPKDLVGIPWMLAFALRNDGADVKAVAALERVMNELTAAYDGEAIPDRVLKVLERLDAEWRQAKGNSWYLRSEIIWHKPNPMPESCRDRPTKSHEQVFLLTKRPKYFYDMDAIREPHTEAGLKRAMCPSGAGFATEGSYHDHSDDLGVGQRIGAPACHPGGRNKRTVWTIPTFAYPKAHFATFPPALVEPCILAGTSARGCCPECGAPWKRVVERKRVATRPGETTKIKVPGGWDTGEGAHGSYHREGRGEPEYREAMEVGNRDPERHVTETETTGWTPTCECGGDPIPCTVLDPFGGSGTVGLVARQHGRDYVLVELNPEYVEQMKQRLDCVQPPLLGVTT